MEEGCGYFERQLPKKDEGFADPVSISEILKLPLSKMALLFDFNGVFTDDEKEQANAWVAAVKKRFGRRLPADMLRRVEAHIRVCFDRGQFHDFRPKLWEFLGEFCSPEVTNPVQLDDYLSVARDEYIMIRVKKRKIVACSGIDKILEDLKDFGVPVGLNTANGEHLVTEMLAEFFGKGVAESLVPSGHRVYGKRLPPEVRGKPFSDSYRYLASRMGVPFDVCVIVEDRMPVIEQCLIDGAAGAVWIAGSQWMEKPGQLWADQVHGRLGELSRKVILVQWPDQLRI